MKKILFVLMAVVAFNTAMAQKEGETLYLIDGKLTNKEAADKLGKEQVKSMTIVKNVKELIVIETNSFGAIANKEKTMENIDSAKLHVTECDVQGHIFMERSDTLNITPLNKPLIIVQEANGVVRVLKNEKELDAEYKPEQIQCVTVFKKAEHCKNFEKYGDVSNGVIIIEMKKE